jgi:hypothetical protein
MRRGSQIIKLSLGDDKTKLLGKGDKQNKAKKKKNPLQGVTNFIFFL